MVNGRRSRAENTQRRCIRGDGIRDGGTEERRREKGLHEDNNDKDKPMRPLTGHLYLSPTPLLHMYGHLPMELLRASWPISWAVACESMR